MGTQRHQRRWRNPRQRERILEAAVNAIAEHGLADLRMAHISERAGMSHGHILYYFGSKQQILLETLSWSENKLTERRASLLASTDDPLQRLRGYIDLAIPVGPRDPNWVLWLEVFALTPHDEGLLEFQLPFDLVWRRDLQHLVADGIRSGAFRSIDAEEFVAWFTALLTGLAIDVVGGYPGSSRDVTAALAQRIALEALGAAEPAR